jgi:hypothetical protein
MHPISSGMLFADQEQALAVFIIICCRQVLVLL